MCSWFWCWSLCSGGIPPSPPACSSVPQAVWLRGGVSLTSVQTFNRFYLTSHLCAAAPLSAIFGYFVCTLTDRCGPSPCASPATASSTSLWFLFLLKNQSSERCQAETFLRWMSSKPLWGQRQQGAEGLFKAMSARLGQNSCGWAVGTLRKTTRCYPAGMREVWLWRHDSGLTAIKICLKKMDPFFPRNCRETRTRHRKIVVQLKVKYLHQPYPHIPLSTKWIRFFFSLHWNHNVCIAAQLHPLPVPV